MRSLKSTRLILTLVVITIVGLSLPPGIAQAQTGITATPTVALNLRAGPGIGYSILEVVPANMTLNVEGRNAAANWVMVTYNGSQGWMAAWYCTIGGSLDAAPVTFTSAAASSLSAYPPDYTTRIRSGAGTNNPQIGLITVWQRVTVTGRDAAGDWVYLDVDGLQGWSAAWLLTFDGDYMALPVTDGTGSAAGDAGGGTTSGVTAVSPTYHMRIRSGPGTSNGQVSLLPPGVSVPVLGRNTASDWVLIDYNGTQGWVAGWYLTISGNLASAEVRDSVAASTPVVPTGSLPAATGFMLGGQSFSFDNAAVMQSAGMTWIKWQHKWGPGQNPADLAGLINDAHNRGLRILLSIPGFENPTSIDYAAYAQYVAGVARLGVDAIEVWNEMNIDREWIVGDINPHSYVNNMLIPAYNAIKAANPNTMVISGATGPTGWNIPGYVMSDDLYIAGMRDAGAANYADCIGFHFNSMASPPDSTTGHPADDGRGHYSWYYTKTLNLYIQTFPNKPLCLTELGVLSPEGYGSLPEGFWWGFDNTVAEQEQWLARAVQIAKDSGHFRMVVIFNVDFRTFGGTDPQGGYAIIRPNGICPACDNLAGVMN